MQNTQTGRARGKRRSAAFLQLLVGFTFLLSAWSPTKGQAQVFFEIDPVILPSGPAITAVTEIYPNNLETVYATDTIPIIVQFHAVSSEWLDHKSSVTVSLFAKGADSPAYVATNPVPTGESSVYVVRDKEVVSLEVADMAPGEYSVKYDITRDDGVTLPVISKKKFTVAAGPSAVIDTSGSSLLSAALDFSAENNASPFGPLQEVFWDFGDNGTSNGLTASHTYTGTGSFLVTTSVTDSAGNTGENQMTVEVLDLPVVSTGLLMLWNMNLQLTGDTEYPQLQFTNNFAGSGERVSISRRAAVLESDLEYQKYEMLAEYNQTGQSQMVYTDGLSTDYHRYVQYLVRIVQDGRVVAEAESSSLWYETSPVTPRFIPSDRANVPEVRYFDRDGDEGLISYKVLEVPAGYTVVNGNLNTNGEVPRSSQVIDCASPPSKMFILEGLSSSGRNDRVVRINLNHIPEGNFFICARAEDEHTQVSTWPEFMLVGSVHENTIGMPTSSDATPLSSNPGASGNPALLTILPSITSSQGGSNNIAPDVPILQSPADGTSQTMGAVTLTAKYTDFNEDDGQLYFRISKSLDCSIGVLEHKTDMIDSGSSGTWTTTDLTEEGTYYWCARAFDTYSYDSIWSAAWEFTLTSPEVPSATTAEDQNDSPEESDGPDATVFNRIVNDSFDDMVVENGNTSDGTNVNANGQIIIPPAGNSQMNANRTVVTQELTKVDTDEDTFADTNEELIYDTNPRDPNSKPVPPSTVLRISNLQNGFIVASSKLFIVGAGPAENSVRILAWQEGEPYELGNTFIDEQGRFALLISSPLSDGTYHIAAETTGSTSERSSDVLITIDTTHVLPAVDLTTLEGETIVPYQPIETTDEKPTVYGEHGANGDIEVIAFWQSLVTGSIGTPQADANQFSLQPEEPLGIGRHVLSVYLVQKDGDFTRLSGVIQLPFEIVEPPPETFSFDNLNPVEPVEASGNMLKTDFLNGNKSSPENIGFWIIGMLLFVGGAATIYLIPSGKKKVVSRKS